jgi:hypothetical protein
VAAAKLPWMPFFGTDFYNDEAVRLMSLEEEAVYIRLLWWQWREGSLPAEPDDLEMLVGNRRAIAGQSPGKMVTDRVLALFPVTRGGDGRRRNPRLQAISEEQEAKNRRRSKAGKIGRRTQLRQQAESRATTRANAGESPANGRANAGQTPGESESESDSKKTWLTPFADAWQAKCGNPPFGRLARDLAPLVKQLGEPEALARWSRYLAGTEPRFCAPARFVMIHAAYAGPETQEMTDEFGRMVLHKRNPAGEWEPIVA